MLHELETHARVVRPVDRLPTCVRAHAHTRTRARARTHTHTDNNTHTHTPTIRKTHTLFRHGKKDALKSDRCTRMSRDGPHCRPDRAAGRMRQGGGTGAACADCAGAAGHNSMRAARRGAKTCHAAALCAKNRTQNKMTAPTPGSHLPRRALRPSHGAGRKRREHTMHRAARAWRRWSVGALCTSAQRCTRAARGTRCFGFSAGERGGARGSHRGRVLLSHTSAACLGRPESGGQRQAGEQEECGRATSHCDGVVLCPGSYKLAVRPPICFKGTVFPLKINLLGGGGSVRAS